MSPAERESGTATPLLERLKAAGLIRYERDASDERRIRLTPRWRSLPGAKYFDPRVEHKAYLLAWAAQLKLPVQQALEMRFYQSVLDEGLRRALRAQAARHQITGQCRCEHLAEAPEA